jgi:flagella basal body P-ring formation protein FlgA
MTFRLITDGWRRFLTVLLAAAIPACGSAMAQGAGPVAVIPTEVIYPGQTLDATMLREVAVTNPNLRSDYIHTISEVDGMVSTRTLLPGRVIPVSAVREPYAVERGKAVRLVYRDGALTISAPGMPLQNAVIGDFIRVRNIDSGITVAGTVTAPGEVEVAAR